MIKLIDILNEIRVIAPITNNLRQLELLQSQIDSTKDIKVKQALSIKCAELVLPIWNINYPDDKRPKEAIEAAKRYLTDPTEENRRAAASSADAAYAASSADSNAASASDYAAAASVYTAVYAAYAANNAIKATKLFFKIN